MKLSRFATYLVIITATFALVGISILQIQNLRKSFETNKKIFLHKVDLASTNIAATFQQDTRNPKLLGDVALCLRKSSSLNDPEMDMMFRRIIDPTLEQHGLDIPYEYAVYEHNQYGDGFRFVMGDDGASLNFTLVGCVNPNERGHGWANLTCSQELGVNDYHLALFFPSQDQYVFAQSRGALMLSILFILLLIACFAYTLIIIQRQKKLSEIKNDFINNLTHEFKTPIASIVLATNMLKREDIQSNDLKKSNYLSLIDQESKRLEGQVDKVLQIAMVDSGNFSLDKKRLDIHEVIENVVTSMTMAVNKRNGNITLQLEAKQSEVMADTTHMVNIVYNLIDNAIKYTMDKPHIIISTVDSDEGIQISIKDNGIGMDEEIQKYIFDKFYRAETGNVHNVTGFGLGLSYVKKIIDAHKGRINLTSQIDQGSEFQLFIPSS